LNVRQIQPGAACLVCASCAFGTRCRQGSDDHACATQQLFDEEGQVIGALNIGFDDPREFSEQELQLLGTLARERAAAMTAARRVQTAVREPSRALSLPS
jgi:GAF domain-containing protein